MAGLVMRGAEERRRVVRRRRFCALESTSRKPEIKKSASTTVTNLRIEFFGINNLLARFEGCGQRKPGCFKSFTLRERLEASRFALAASLKTSEEVVDAEEFNS